MVLLKDSIVQEIIQFLEHCEGLCLSAFLQVQYLHCFPPQSLILAYGHNVPTVVELPLDQQPIHAGRNTITYEARLLKALFLRLVE